MHIYRLILDVNFYENQYFDHKGNNIDTIAAPVIGDKINITINRDSYKRRYGFDLSEQEINNFIHHRIAWKAFEKSKEEFCMIIESNVSLNISSLDFKNIENSFPEDMDIFFPYDRIQYINCHPLTKKVLKNKNLHETNINEPYVLGYKWGNSIYFISKKGVKKLLRIKPIDDRLDNKLVKMSLAEELNLYYSSQEWLNMNQIDWKEWPERIKNIWNSALNSSSWTTSRKKDACILLSLVSEIASKLKIKLILEGGTLLGYIQHGGIMPWDDDIDIGINECDVSFFLKELLLIRDLRYDEIIEEWSGKSFYKIWAIEGERIENKEYTFPFIDLWVYHKCGNDLVYRNGIMLHRSALKPFSKIVFEKNTYYIPHNPQQVLDDRYKYWRHKVIVYTWSHLLEKISFNSFIIPIKTDQEGKMLELDCYNIF